MTLINLERSGVKCLFFSYGSPYCLTCRMVHTGRGIFQGGHWSTMLSILGEGSAPAFQKFVRPTSQIIYMCPHMVWETVTLFFKASTPDERKIFYRADNALALAKKFVTWILMHDLFVVANILVSIILCCSDPLAMSNKASTAQLFDNMSLDIEQLLTKVC